MFYPTGKTTGGRIIVCKCCNEDELSDIKKDDTIALQGLSEWLNENNYCMETWQVKKYLHELGIDENEINETMDGYDAEIKFKFLNKVAEDVFEASEFYPLVELDETDNFVTDKKTFEIINSFLQDQGFNSSDDYTVIMDEDAMAAPAPGAPAAGFSTPATVSGMGNVASPTNTGTNASFYNPSAVGSGDRFDAHSVSGKGSKKKTKSKKYPIVKNFSDFVSAMKKLQG